MAKPWWVNVKGGHNAIDGMAKFGVGGALRNAWYVANSTRLHDNPELGAAVSAAGMDYAAARRLDIAFQATKADKQKSIMDDANIPDSMRDPGMSRPAAAQKRAEDDRAKLTATLNSKPPERGFWSGVWHWLAPSAEDMVRDNKATIEARMRGDQGDWWDRQMAGLDNAAKPVMNAVESAAGGVWDVGKEALQGLEWVGRTALSPVAAPLAAASAAGGDPDAGNGASNTLITRGWNIITGDEPLNDPQKADMRKAGYNPDSWAERYQYYANFTGERELVSNKSVDRAKDKHNPYKVDLAREILSLGVLDDPKKFNGLSEDAQRLYQEVGRGKDKEGGEILKMLGDQSAFTLGGHLADEFDLELGSTGRQIVSTIGDLAAYWYIDPLVVGSKATVAYRDARFGVAFDQQEIKEAIVNGLNGNNKIANRWDDALDRIDRIHVLSEGKTAESVAQAAKETTRFMQKYQDMMPFYDTLLGLRSGAVSGTFFKAPAKNAKVRDMADLNVVGINRVDDVAKRKPMFELRKNIDDVVTQDTRDAARASVADLIGDAIFGMKMMEGKPIVNNKMLMPGQIRLLYPLRVGLQGFTDKVLGQSGKLFEHLKEAEGKGILDFSKATTGSAATAGIVDSAAGGKWLRDEYTRGGLRDRMAMALSRFAVTKDAPVIKFDGVGDSTKDIYNFARFFMPRGHAAFTATQWAKADPAARSLMLDNLVESIGNARFTLDNKVATDFWRQQMKGRQTPLRRGESPKEAYSSPNTDQILTPSGRVAAAMYSTQFADGVKLPSYVQLLVNTEKVGLFGWLAGVSHSRFPSAFTRVMKVGQIGTTSNALRQMGEGRGLQWMDDPLGAARVTLARLGLAGNTATERVATNNALRQAREIRKSGEMDRLTPLLERHLNDEFIAEAGLIVKGDLSPVLKDWMSEVGSADDFLKMSRARSGARLALSKVAVDPLRRARAHIYAPLTDKATDAFTFEWLDRVDDSFAQRLQDGVHSILGGQRAHYMDGAMVDDLDQMAEGLKAGQRLGKVRLTNTVGYLETAGDVGAMRWANALGLRLADPAGNEVIQAVAKNALHEMRIQRRAEKAGQLGGPALRAQVEAKLRAAPTDFLRVHAERQVAGDVREFRKNLPQGIPEAVVNRQIQRIFVEPKLAEMNGLKTPNDLAGYLLTKGKEGESYRLSGRRGQYDGTGNYIGADAAAKDAQLHAWGDQMVTDAERYLGLDSAAFATGTIDRNHVRFLQQMAKGGDNMQPSMLSKVPDGLRPDEVHAPIIIGKKFLEGYDGNAVVAGAAKLYDFVVANPLRRMVHDPQVVAAHHEAMAAMEPLAKALNKQGMSADNIYNTLDSMAYGHALNRVARYSDNPRVTSYFAALSNNWLWYERAMEDWARRVIQIGKADPAKVARANLMWEAANHSGMVYKQRTADEEGNQKDEYMFTWPGSGLMMRAMNEAAQALGFVDDSIVKVPVWQDWASPVKFLNASANNPIGFTTTPLVGMPMRVTKWIFPESTIAIDNVLTNLEGGERYFGAQNMVESLLPVYLRRAWNAVEGKINPEDGDSQLASATRNALIYMHAAGKLPGPEATDTERQIANDQVRQQVQNNLIWRTLFASFAPATPGSMTTNVAGEGDTAMTELDRLRGIQSIRGSWFQLLEEMSQRFPKDFNQAFSEAATEWARRDLGSIVNPTAFTVGSAGAPGWDTGKSFPSNLETTQWMLDNRNFLKEYGAAAFALIPKMGDEYYSQIGYQVQLKTDLRQHKTGREFYEDLVMAQTNADFYRKLDQRDEMLDKASGAQRNQVYDWWNKYVADMERANPLWARKRNEMTDPDQVRGNSASQVAQLATAENLPAEVKELQPKIRLMADLYTEYQRAVAKYNSPLAGDIRARRDLASRYNRRGNELFKATPLNSLWSSMKVWQD